MLHYKQITWLDDHSVDMNFWLGYSDDNTNHTMDTSHVIDVCYISQAFTPPTHQDPLDASEGLGQLKELLHTTVSRR